MELAPCTSRTDAALLCHCTRCQGVPMCRTDGACFSKVLVTEHFDFFPFSSCFLQLPTFSSHSVSCCATSDIPPSPSPLLPRLSPTSFLPLLPHLSPSLTSPPPPSPLPLPHLSPSSFTSPPPLLPHAAHMPCISLPSSQPVVGSPVIELGCYSRSMLAMCRAEFNSLCCNTSLCNGQTQDTTTVQGENSSGSEDLWAGHM